MKKTIIITAIAILCALSINAKAQDWEGREGSGQKEKGEYGERRGNGEIKKKAEALKAEMKKKAQAILKEIKALHEKIENKHSELEKLHEEMKEKMDALKAEAEKKRSQMESGRGGDNDGTAYGSENGGKKKKMHKKVEDNDNGEI